MNGNYDLQNAPRLLKFVFRHFLDIAARHRVPALLLGFFFLLSLTFMILSFLFPQVITVLRQEGHSIPSTFPPVKDCFLPTFIVPSLQA